MKLLKQLHSDLTTTISWIINESERVASFTSYDKTKHLIEFKSIDEMSWDVSLEHNFTHSLKTYSSMISSFIQMNEGCEYILNISTSEQNISNLSHLINEMDIVYDCNIRKVKDNQYEISNKFYGTEILSEEPNTSLMYHKLFPSKYLLRKLKEKGYTFKMGEGLKIYKKHYGSTNRGSGPSKRRTLQSIVILKDGKFFRKIPKSKWVQMKDPSDRESSIWGVIFMRKLLDNP
jgi:hypothetical protein